MLQRNRLPERFIRACRLRDPQTGNSGPWLAGMTLDPDVVHEAWCHQRGYVCMIEEFGGRPIKAGESFSAAFIVGEDYGTRASTVVLERTDGRVEFIERRFGPSGEAVGEDAFRFPSSD